MPRNRACWVFTGNPGSSISTVCRWAVMRFARASAAKHPSIAPTTGTQHEAGTDTFMNSFTNRAASSLSSGTPSKGA